jgi:hypothetical protein
MGYALGFEGPARGVGGLVTINIDKYADLVPAQRLWIRKLDHL